MARLLDDFAQRRGSEKIGRKQPNIYDRCGAGLSNFPRYSRRPVGCLGPIAAAYDGRHGPGPCSEEEEDPTRNGEGRSRTRRTMKTSLTSTNELPWGQGWSSDLGVRLNPCTCVGTGINRVRRSDKLDANCVFSALVAL